MSPSERGADGVQVHVCIECGNERFVEAGESPSTAPCEKCGNQVFRAFDSGVGGDEPARDFADTTGRETATNEPAPDTVAGDVADLNNP